MVCLFRVENHASVHCSCIELFLFCNQTQFVNRSVILSISFLDSHFSSFPGYVPTIRAIFHSHLLCLGSSSNTRSPIWMLSRTRNHLFLGNKFGAKYFIQLLQKSATLFCVLLNNVADWFFPLVVVVDCSDLEVGHLE